MAFYYDKNIDILEAEYDRTNLGIRIHPAHPNPAMTGTGHPVIDTPVIDVGGGNTIEIQCRLEGSPRIQNETERVPHETERQADKSEQSEECEVSVNRIKFRAFAKEVELIFMCEETRGVGSALQQKVTVSQLMPASKYKILITQFSGEKQVWKMEQCISTKPPFGPPVNFRVEKQPDGMFYFCWEKPCVEPGFTIDRYTISVDTYLQRGLHGYKKYEFNGEYRCALIRLEEGVNYVFEIQASCEDFVSAPSRREWTVLKHEMVNNGHMLKSTGWSTYLVSAETTDERGDISLKEVGKEAYSDITQIEKVILVLGQTGSGKTTWINAMLNYLLDVNYTDNFRFKLVIDENADHQELSQTQATTIYKIYHKKGYNIDFTLNLIDTPGFGDTGGIERDKGIAKQLQSIFDVHSGFVDHLDAVVFVTKSNHQRLDPCQKYILSSITELFGTDIAENIYLVFTHSGIEEPAMLATLQGAELPYKTYFQFDNAAVFDDIEKVADKTEQSHKGSLRRKRLMENKEKLRKDLYDAAMDEFNEFFSEVQSAPAKGLTTTRHVLAKRMILRQNISDLNSLVRKGLDQMDQLKIAVMATTKWDDEIKQTKDYTVESEEAVKKMMKKSGWRATTVCTECKHTCHRDCLVFVDFMKSICHVMDRSTSPPSCTKCPNKCAWKYHKNLKYIYEEQLENVQRILHDHKKRYEEAQGKKLTAEELCDNIKNELKATEAKMKANLSEITESIQELRKIGMKSDETSQLNYIDILIEREKQNASPGQKNKLAVLYDLRKQAKDMIDITKGEYDPFRIYREKAKQICEENHHIKEFDPWINVADNIKQAAKQTGMVRRVLNYAFGASVTESAKEWTLGQMYHTVMLTCVNQLDKVINDALKHRENGTCTSCTQYEIYCSDTKYSKDDIVNISSYLTHGIRWMSYISHVTHVLLPFSWRIYSQQPIDRLLNGQSEPVSWLWVFATSGVGY